MGAVQATNLINLYSSPLMPLNGESMSTQIDVSPSMYGNGIGQMIPMSTSGIMADQYYHSSTSTPPIADYCSSSNHHNNSPILPFYTPTPASPLADALLSAQHQQLIKTTVTVPRIPPASRKRQRVALATNSASAAGPNCGSYLTFSGHHDLSLHMMQIDQLISSHMERMRFEIVERQRAQSRRIMEAAMMKILRGKEDEIAKIGKINEALVEKANALSKENQIWRGLAQTNEATANALRTKLQQILVLSQSSRADQCVGSVGAEDAESCCGSTGWMKVGGVEDGDSQEEEEGKGSDIGGRRERTTGKKMMSCRRCGKGESSVLLLPCRHLCLCSGCGPQVEACPMCYSAKAASILVNLS